MEKSTAQQARAIKEADSFYCINCGILYHVNFMSDRFNKCKICRKEDADLQERGQVFIVNHINKNMKDANQYGALIPLTEGSVNVFNTERMVFELDQKLTDYKFNHEEDYILLSGSTVLNFIVGFLLSKYKQIKLLIWDAKNQRYVLREVRL